MKIVSVFSSLVKKYVYSIILSMVMYLLFCIPADGFSNVTCSGKVDTARVIKSTFDPKTAKWDITWPGRISQYDLVYRSPPIDPMQGIPLGNGDVGVLLWCEDSKIIAVVNKSDLWEDATFGPFYTWDDKEEEYSTTQRHA